MTTGGEGRAARAPLDYQQAKQLASHADPGVRAALAGRDDLRLELLYYLAADPDPAVRRAIAVNRKTPGQADLLLARDQDVEVRADLAAKITRLIPGLAEEERDHIGRATHEVLDILARDQVARVRRIIAETLKSVANAPAEIVQRLARDADLSVAAPLLEFSPLLSDADLLDIIRAGTTVGRLAAIGRRNELGERISDTIAASKDVTAIAALLGNASAQIREETLDRLIDRAPLIEPWHEPLCRRPWLPLGAAARLARFVADRLLDVLQSRQDLDKATMAAVTKEVLRRLDEETPSPGTDGGDTDDGRSAAKEMFDRGELTMEAVRAAVQAGRRTFCIEALSLLAGLPVGLIDKVLLTRSAKGVLAVCWKAELPVSTSAEIQRRLAGIRPDSILDSRNGEYPMAPAEMTWQLEFFADLNRDRS